MKENENMEQNQKKDDKVGIKFPAAFAKPYIYTAKDGKEWQKAIINIPPGTNMNGIDLTGYSIDVFLNDWQKSQIANGDPLVVNLNENEKVEAFRGRGETKEKLHLDPWNLTKAVKAQRDAWAAEHRPSLAERAAGAVEAADAMAAGHGKQEPQRDVEQR